MRSPTAMRMLLRPRHRFVAMRMGSLVAMRVQFSLHHGRMGMAIRMRGRLVHRFCHGQRRVPVGMAIRVVVGGVLAHRLRGR